MEESLTYTAVVMMLFTLAYVSSSQSEVRRRRKGAARMGRDMTATEDNNANAFTEQIKVVSQSGQLIRTRSFNIFFLFF